MTMVLMPGALGYWHNAAMRNFALDVFKLDGGVVDLESMVQLVLYVAQYAFAG